MYKMILIILAFVLNIASSIAFAQEFTFRPFESPAATSNRSSSLSADDFSKSSSDAYQQQQAKIAAIAAKQAQEAEMNRARAVQAGKLPQGTVQQPSPVQSTVQPPPQVMPQGNTNANASSTPESVTPPTLPPASQPYTGFQRQSTPSTSGGSGYNNGGTPRNNNQNQNQNSGGWGSSIKY